MNFWSNNIRAILGFALLLVLIVPQVVRNYSKPAYYDAEASLRIDLIKECEVANAGSKCTLVALPVSVD